MNFLKNLVSGIFSFLSGLFGSKKSEKASLEGQPKTRRDPKSKYFLELDEAKKLIPDSAKPVTQDSTQSPSSPNGKTDKPAPAAVGPVKADPQPVAKTKSVPASSSESEQHSEPVAVANPLNLPQPTVTTFAPNYLQPTASSNGRRRPGANMASFLDMARQVKTSS